MFGQDDRIFELKERLGKATNIHQKIDLNLGLSLAYLHHEFDLSTATEYAKLALEISIEEKIPKYEAIALAFQGRLKNLANDTSHIKTIQRAVQLAETIDDPQALAVCLGIYAEFLWNLEDDLTGRLGAFLERRTSELSDVEKGVLYFEKGFGHHEEGELEEALLDYNSALDLLESGIRFDRPFLDGPSSIELDQVNSTIVRTYLKKALLFKDLYNEEEAISLAKNTLSIAETKVSKANVHVELAYIEMSFGRFDDVTKNLSLALDIFKEIGQVQDFCVSTRDLADFYMRVKQYDEAESVLAQSELNYLNRSPFQKALDLNMLASINLSQEKFEAAKTNFTKAGELFKTVGDLKGFQMTKLGIANALLRQNEDDSSKRLVEELIPQFEATNQKGRLVECYFILSQISRNKGAIQQAIDYSKLSLASTQSSEITSSFKRRLHKFLSELYEEKNKFELSLMHLKLFYENEFEFGEILANSRENEYQIKVNQFIESENEAREKAIEAEQEAIRVQRQNRIFLGVSALLLSLLSIGSYLFIQLRKTQKKVSEQNDKLEALNKTKDKFFALIAHDLRSPIIALKNVDKQMSYYAEKGDQKKMMKASTLVGQTANRVLYLLDNLLSWALSESNMIQYKPEVISLHTAVEETIRLLESSAVQKEVSIENEVAHATSVYVDRNSLNTIIRNLISNAIKFSDAGDQITIGNRPDDGQIGKFWIEDTGRGMSLTQVQNIFKLGRKINKGTKGESGTGLGLVLVRDLVNLNKGSIDLSSEEGKGTRFTLTFPIK